MKYLSITQTANKLGIPPRILSDLFYGRVLSEDRCPMFAGRRAIPEDYIPEIRRVLIERGKLKEEGAMT